jgi:hypothetical protein
MRHIVFAIVIPIAILAFNSVAMAQATEYYAGSKRTGIDIMWFKYFKNHKGINTPFLFFSRNRASIDYDNKSGIFGNTNAVSYNFKNGLGIVGVASFLNTGLTAKAGIQYFKQKGSIMFFGWMVADLKSKENIDLFGMLRYTPKINKHLKGFFQAELFPVYNPTTGRINITERLRVGMKHDAFGFGLMLDFNQVGKTNFSTTENIGGFLRYDF